jgi:hypothetical protein
VGETRVDLRHLLEDLRDAYSGSIEETIVTEVVANALDAGASTIAITATPAEAALTIVDDGRGMLRRELARYHDIASSTKRRGEGIGFAGVGVKLGLLVSTDVVTETRRGGTHVATRWSLAARHRAPWKWMPPPALVARRGTAVRLTLDNPLSALLDAGFVEATIRRHFEPLLDPAFAGILGRHYANAVTLTIDGRRLDPMVVAQADVAPVSIRLARKRLPSAAGWLARSPTPLPPDRAGIAISTLGKVIKRGWDWLGLSPAAADRVSGLIEAPQLAECLTLNKNDFLRTGARGATYLAYRKAIQEVVSRQLAAWGDERTEPSPPPRPARLDRDLERVLEDLAEEFPLLHSLVERRRGGQRKLPMPGRGENGSFGPLVALAEASDTATTPPPDDGPPPDAGDRPQGTDATPPPPAGPPDPQAGDAAIPGEHAPRRRAQYGLTVQFESRPGDEEPGRLVDSTIWVNQAHPAFVRASSSRSLGYHLALTVALTLAPLAVTPEREHGFVTRFLAGWGQAQSDRPRARDRRRGGRRAVRPKP